MDFINTKVRFRIIGPSSEGPIDMDSWTWTVEGDKNYANRTIIKLAYKYMHEVVNDALYNPEDCSLHFYDNSFLGESMLIAVIKHRDDILYSIESYTIIQIDPTHFQYRGYVITVDASHGDNGVLHVVDSRNGFYMAGYDIINDSVDITLLSIYKSIDLVLSKD